MADDPTETPEVEPRRLTLRTVPFQDQEARVIRAQAEREARERAEKSRAEFTMKVKVTEALTDTLPRDGMADVFFAAARRIGMELLLGNVPIRNASEAASAINALVSAGRLEKGESTSNIGVEPKNREEAEARLKSLQDEVAARRAQLGGSTAG